MESTKVRLPAVAGQFYPSSPPELKKTIQSFAAAVSHPQEAFGCIVPHAGYMYSGAVAARTFSAVKARKKIILVGPNHTGLGVRFSIMCAGRWETPLGLVDIDSSLSESILKNSKYLKADTLAHASEHSLEVQLPFLQYFFHEFQIVPIVVSSNETQVLKDIGMEIGRTIKEQNIGSDCLLVASTDMTHYEPQDTAQKKDREAIQAILELDTDMLVEKIQKLDISMCGWAPTVVVLTCAKFLGASKAKLVHYQTSGDVTGDYDSVVGYAGVILT